MAWLIRERANLQGKLDLAKRRQLVYQVRLARAQETLVTLEAQLAALPADLVGGRTPLAPRLAKRQGELRVMLLDFIRRDHPGPTSTRVIKDRYVLAVGADNVPCSVSMLKNRLNTALWNMERAGLIRRCPEKLDGGNLWELAVVQEKQDAV